AVSIFGGGPLDDDLRAIRVNGSKFTGLFDTARGPVPDLCRRPVGPLPDLYRISRIFSRIA
ncbi:hypothetical protein ACWDZ5_32120, partial [Streptomyces sp. NPDC002996]